MEHPVVGVKYSSEKFGFDTGYVIWERNQVLEILENKEFTNIFLRINNNMICFIRM